MSSRLIRIRARLATWPVVLALAVVAGFLGVTALIGNGGDEGVAATPPDHAAALVPRETLVYVHATLDRGSPQWERARRVFDRLPGLARLRDRAARALVPGSGSLDLGRNVEPWIGDEAALALLPGDGAARSLILAGVSDKGRAEQFLERAVGRVRRTSRRGTDIRVRGALATAFVGDFLLVGQLANVRRAIDVRAHPSLSLEQDPVFRRARRKLPEGERIAYAYAPREGVRGLLARRSDLLGESMRLVDDRALEGAAAAVRLEEQGARIDAASALRGGARRGKRPSSFVPELPDAIPDAAVAYLGMRGADRLLEVATEAGGGRVPLLGALARLENDLARSGLRLRRALRPLLRKEAALLVTSSAASTVLTLVVDDVRSEEFGRLLDRLQPLFADSLGGRAEGLVPTLEPRRVAGVNAATLRITPTLSLTYAVFGGRAVVSTSARGIAVLRRSASPIGKNPLLTSALAGLGRVTSVVFLDLRRLLAIGEQAGLGQSPSYRALESDLSGIGAVSAVTRNEATSKSAKIFIEVQ